MARTVKDVLSGFVTLSVIERRRPQELILAVDLKTKKAETYYHEVVGSLRLHHKATSKSNKQRARLYALNGDIYYGMIYHGEFVYGVFQKLEQ